MESGGDKFFKYLQYFMWILFAPIWIWSLAILFLFTPLKYLIFFWTAYINTHVPNEAAFYKLNYIADYEANTPERDIVTLKKFFNDLKSKNYASNKRNALLISAESEGKISEWLLEGDFNLVAIDTQRCGLEYLPIVKERKDQVKIYNNKLDIINNLSPKIDMAVARFVLSFLPKNKALNLFKEIDEKLLVKGYIVINFLGKNWFNTKLSSTENMSFYDEREIKEILKNYKIINLQTIKNISIDGIDEVIEVIAQKIS